MYKIGDKGLIVEYINWYLGVKSKTYTQETEDKVKLFQSTYDQDFVDNSFDIEYVYDSTTGTYNPTGIPYDYYNQYFIPNVNTGRNRPYICPSGSVDLFTLPALTGMEISFNDSNKIKNAQQALSGTKYSNQKVIAATGIYDQQTMSAIEAFQIEQSIGVVMNLYDYETLIVQPSSTNGVSISKIADGYEISGVSTSSNVYGVVSVTGLVPNDVYTLMTTFEQKGDITIVGTPIYNSSGEVLIDSNISRDSGTNYIYFTAPEDGSVFIRFYSNKTPTQTYTLCDFTNIMIAKGEHSRLEYIDYITSETNESGLYCSGILNIPTYNRLKMIYRFQEVV